MKDKMYQNGRPTWFYENCKRQRKNGAKICITCPFRVEIEAFEKAEEFAKHSAQERCEKAREHMSQIPMGIKVFEEMVWINEALRIAAGLEPEKE